MVSTINTLLKPYPSRHTKHAGLGRRKTLALAVALASLPIISHAQDRPVLEEVVVTGTASGGDIRKLDASFAITNVNEEDIEQFSPDSTADLLKMVPGVWSESSGGVSGANVFVRGFPGGGDAPFLTLQLEGAPVFPPPTVSFLENTTLFRIDETVERMEALRGGPQSVQDNGQPGLTTNFLLKRGGEETEGVFKYTTSDYDLQRLDMRASGKLADDLYYMVGGYVKSTPGVRDAGFNAEEGNQFTVKITKEFADSSLNLYHRVTDDHGVWFLPVALNVPGVDGAYTQVGVLNRQNTIQYGPDGETKEADLGEGRGWDGSVSGATFDLDINDTWTLNNSLNLTRGAADTLGLVPNGGAIRVGDLLASPADYPDAVVTDPLSGRVSGRDIGDDEFVQQFGVWEVRKDIESFTNNLAMTGDYDRYDITLGLYSARASVDEWWSLGNHRYQVVQQGGEIVEGIACNDPAVDSCGWNYDIDARGDSRSMAYYLASTFDASDALSVDFGLRSENHEIAYSVDEGLDGLITKTVDYDESELSYTLGANYSLSDFHGVFARYSEGIKFPYFDDFRDNYDAFSGGDDLIKDVTQLELGYKGGFDSLSLYATFFYNEVLGDTFVPQPGAPAQRFTNEAMGVELDGRWMTDTGFQMSFNATIQETEIKDSPTDNGNEAQRQPGYMLRLTPSYDFELSSGMLATVYGTVSLVDDRFSDNSNTVVLPGYEKLDLGFILDANENLSFQIVADNITDEEGLTEGDPRNPTAPNGRYIMPASIKFSVGYSF